MEKKVLDWKEYLNIARQAVAEGIVLLENNNGVLPLPKNEKVSIFGREGGTSDPKRRDSFRVWTDCLYLL